MSDATAQALIAALDDAALDRLAEALASRIAAHLADQIPVAGPSSRLVDAAAVARALGVRREWVYQHKRELGGRPIGGGERPRWRFDLADALSRFAELERTTTTAPPPSPRRRRRTTASADVALLPIRPATPRRPRRAA